MASVCVSSPILLAPTIWDPILIFSILGCVLPLQEAELSQRPPIFSVLCYPCPCRSLLLHKVISPTTFWSSDSLLSFIQAMCPAHFYFVLVTYWTMPVTLLLCLMVVLGILSFSLTLSIFLSMVRWLISRFFTNAFVRDHVWRSYVIWLKPRQ